MVQDLEIASLQVLALSVHTFAPSVCGNMVSTGLLPCPSELQHLFSKDMMVRGLCGDRTTCTSSSKWSQQPA